MIQKFLSNLSYTNKRDYQAGLSSFWSTHRFIKEHGMMGNIISIGLFFLLLFTAYIIGIYYFGDYVFDLIYKWPWLNGIRDKFTWVSGIIKIFNFIFIALVVYVFVVLYKYIVLFLGSPFFSYLSEKTELKYTNQNYEFNLGRFIKDIFRGIALAFRNFFRQTIFTLIFWIISFVPFLGWIAPWIIARKDWYYYGFSMLDYSCERHSMNVKESLLFMKSHSGLAVMNGLMFYLLLLIPLLGPIIAPSYCVVAATLAFLKIKEDEQKR